MIKVYTVIAYRWGDTENHSYVVGVYSEPKAAIIAANSEEDYRGGKYKCRVLEWIVDQGGEGGKYDKRNRVIKEIDD